MPPSRPCLLVDGTATHVVLLELGDEKLLVVKQVELVAVKRLLHGVDYHVHLVVRIEFGHLVALSDAPAVPLLQVRRPPRCVEMMDGYTPLPGR